MSVSKGELLLVDGSSYLYRAFHALPALKTSQGEPVGAIYGIISMLRKLQKETSSKDRILVVFDSPSPTFRHKLYPLYKANRVKMPEELQQQIPALNAIIPAMGLTCIKQEGIEADDIIATLARQAQDVGIQTLIYTNDKDFAQLVNPAISLMNAMTGMRIDRAGVIQNFGVTPEQMVDYLSLVGDTSDNVPGVPGVGPKTAAKWLAQYGSLEQILICANEITGKVGANLRAHKEHIGLAKRLITIDQNISLDYDLNNLPSAQSEPAVLFQWFKKLEFKKWADEFQYSYRSEHSLQAHELILSLNSFEAWLKELQEAEYLLIDVETTSLNTLDAKLVGIGLGLSPTRVVYIPLQHDYDAAPDQLPLDTVLSKLKPYLESSTLKKIGHNLKYDRGVLANYDIELQGLYADTLLEAYLLDSAYKRYDLDSLAYQYLNYQPVSFEEIAGKGKNALSFNGITLDKAAPYAAEDVSVCLALHKLFEPQLEKAGTLKVRDTLEMPLISVLSRIERQGVLVNAALLQQQSQALTERLSILEEQSYQVAGQLFNLDSPKQLQEVLYQVHQLPVYYKTSTGQPATSEKALQKLSIAHKLPRLILEYRTLRKLKSTYTDTLPQQIHPKTGRVHTAYHQAVVATGRLSSSKPNLQNIPIRTEEGRKIRRAFEAPSGYKLLSADYSQIELRIMAHFSEDISLLTAFQYDQDIHVATAAMLFNVKLTDVDAEQRRRAKTVNFGLIYGMSPFGLATQLNIEPEVAQQIIEEYFIRYPGVKKYMEQARAQAHKQGYVQTLLGRRLALPMIYNKNKRHQQAAERAAINAPLQGTAADIIKQAMVTIDHELNYNSIAARMVMQVHDELVFEVKESELEAAKMCIVRGMETAGQLKVPLKVSIGVGNNWEEAH
jgi:DNA polymerase-1